MNTVVELSEFIRKATKLLDEEEKRELIDYLARNPLAGVLVRGTGGIRKLRWRRQGSGKSGGVRIIYFFHNEQIPLFLLTIFSKSQKANLSKSQQDSLRKLTEILVEKYR